MAIKGDNLKKLDMAIQRLFVENYSLVCHISNIDKTQVYVCLEIGKGKSMGQIATVLGVSRQSVMARKKKCKCPADDTPSDQPVTLKK